MKERGLQCQKRCCRPFSIKYQIFIAAAAAKSNHHHAMYHKHHPLSFSRPHFTLAIFTITSLIIFYLNLSLPSRVSLPFSIYATQTIIHLCVFCSFQFFFSLVPCLFATQTFPFLYLSVLKKHKALLCTVFFSKLYSIYIFSVYVWL